MRIMHTATFNLHFKVQIVRIIFEVLW